MYQSLSCLRRLVGGDWLRQPRGADAGGFPEQPAVDPGRPTEGLCSGGKLFNRSQLPFPPLQSEEKSSDSVRLF